MKTLETQGGFRSLLDKTMILLNDIVKVFDLPDLDRFCRICKKEEDIGIKSCDFKENNDADFMPDIAAKI